MVKRMMTIITTRKRSRKKILRFNSYQPELEKNKKSERVLNKDNLDYDIDKNENIIVNNILMLYKFIFVVASELDINLELELRTTTSVSSLFTKF